MRQSFSLWVNWVLANTIGLATGLLLGYFVNSRIWFYPPLPDGLYLNLVDHYSMHKMVIIGAAIGLCIGVFEWLVIRRYISNAGLWIVASVLGWGIGVLIRELLSAQGEVFWIILAGIPVGIMQWLILRKTYYDIGLWAILSAIVNILIAIQIVPTPVFWPATGWWIYQSIFGLVRGAILGCVLVYLVGCPNQEELVDV
jgi:hypothetical protein